MNFETKLFQAYHVNREKLIRYGFEKRKYDYVWSKTMSEPSLRMEVVVDEDGKVHASIMDTVFEEEYTQYRLEYAEGEFVNRVKEEFIAVLMDIRTQCFTKSYFVSNQANRLAHRIKAQFGDEPLFLWENTPNAAVFKNPTTQKWYALIMNLSGKTVHVSSETIDILNVKLPSDQIEQLLKRSGFVPAYHMNKKHWITILLDDSLEDDEIMEYIVQSHGNAHYRNEWIVPANPKYYDVISEFEQTDTITWKQTAHMQKGNMVYLYFGLPYSAILYKCIVVEVDLPTTSRDQKGRMKKQMRIQRIEKYKEGQYPLSLLKQWGVKSVRGARSMPEELSRFINHENDESE